MVIDLGNRATIANGVPKVSRNKRVVPTKIMLVWGITLRFYGYSTPHSSALFSAIMINNYRVSPCGSKVQFPTQDGVDKCLTLYWGISTNQNWLNLVLKFWSDQKIGAAMPLFWNMTHLPIYTSTSIYSIYVYFFWFTYIYTDVYIYIYTYIHTYIHISNTKTKQPACVCTCMILCTYVEAKLERYKNASAHGVYSHT